MIDDENLDKKMGVTMNDELNKQIVALNGLAVMLQMVDIRGHVTLDAVAWGLKNLAALGVWLQRNPGIDLRLPIDEVATLTRGLLKMRLKRLQSSQLLQTAVEEPAQEVSEHSLSGKFVKVSDYLHLRLNDATVGVVVSESERLLTSEQLDPKKWGQSGRRENGDRVDLDGVMESLVEVTAQLLRMQEMIEKVWLEVRHA